MWVSNVRWMRKGGIVIKAFSVNGDLVADAAVSLKKTLGKLTEDALFVIVELPYIIKIDRKNINVLQESSAAMGKKGGRLVVVKIGGFPEGLARNRPLEIYPTLAKARKSFG